MAGDPVGSLGAKLVAILASGQADHIVPREKRAQTVSLVEGIRRKSPMIFAHEGEKPIRFRDLSSPRRIIK
jgi:hypothetical protein